MSALRHYFSMPALRRLLGSALVLTAFVPLHRLLDPTRTGLAGMATRDHLDPIWASGLWGTLLVAGAAAALTLLTPADPAAWGRAVARRLTRIPTGAFAAGCAGVALAASGSVALHLFGGLPTSADEMVQLLHARVLSTGQAALPLPGDAAAWMIQNSVVTPEGWASIYPPLHTALLALGLSGGAPWLVGPVAHALTAGLTCLALSRLWPGRPGVVRITAVLVALSPFMALVGGTALSHTTAAALASLTLWTTLRARDGAAPWGVAAGAAVGAFVCTRPWAGLVLSAAIIATVWLPVARLQAPSWTLRRMAALCAGGAPFAAALLAWNRHLFDHPLRLGYSAAFGPAHGLGFHTDPWGNSYGVVEALAYTGADLLHLGSALLASPVPALSLIGVALLVFPGGWRRAGPIWAWAVAGVGANAVYWHHGIHMGPRLLYETAPAWLALWVLAAATLTGGRPTRRGRVGRGVTWVVALSAVGALLLAPTQLRANGDGPLSDTALVPPDSTATLVFAHGSWSSRVAARLTAAGMRRDSAETALRRNDLCAVDAYSRWRMGGGTGSPPPLELDPRPGRPGHLAPMTLSPGNVVWLAPERVPSEACLREARADRLGTVELEPLLWQAPPVGGGRLVVARDLGPSANAAVLGSYPGWTVRVLVPDTATTPGWTLLPYEPAMTLLWGDG